MFVKNKDKLTSKKDFHRVTPNKRKDSPKFRLNSAPLCVFLCESLRNKTMLVLFHAQQILLKRQTFHLQKVLRYLDVILGILHLA